MGERTLNEQILDVLDMALRPLSAADIRRRLKGDVQPDEVSSRLAKMKRQGKAVSVEMPSQSITGPRLIKGWVATTNPMTLEHVPSIAKNPENSDILSGEEASGVSVSQKAA